MNLKSHINLLTDTILKDVIEGQLMHIDEKKFVVLSSKMIERYNLLTGNDPSCYLQDEGTIGYVAYEGEGLTEEQLLAVKDEEFLEFYSISQLNELVREVRSGSIFGKESISEDDLYEMLIYIALVKLNEEANN